MVARPGNRVARISPLVPGVDLVGTVRRSGDPSVGVGQPGDRPRLRPRRGPPRGFAQLARVPAGWVVPLPTGLDARQAATIGTAGFTAALSLHRLEHHGPPARTTVRCWSPGPPGGWVSMAVALLAVPRLRGGGQHRQGRRSTPTSPAWAPPRSSAATNWTVDPERTLGPERWAGAVDCVGGATLAAVLRTLRYGAAVAASGLTGGTALEIHRLPLHRAGRRPHRGRHRARPRSPSGGPCGRSWPPPTPRPCSTTWSMRGRPRRLGAGARADPGRRRAGAGCWSRPSAEPAAGPAVGPTVGGRGLGVGRGRRGRPGTPPWSRRRTAPARPP